MIWQKYVKYWKHRIRRIAKLWKVLAEWFESEFK